MLMFSLQEEALKKALSNYFLIRFMYTINSYGNNQNLVSHQSEWTQLPYKNYIRDEHFFQNRLLLHKTMVTGRLPIDFEIISKVMKIPVTWKMKWVIFVKEHNSCCSAFEPLYIPINCEFIVAELQNDTKTFKLTEIYKLGKQEQLVTRHWGSWSDGKLETPTVELLRRRQNIMGHVLRQVTMKVDRDDPDMEFQEKIMSFLRDGMNSTKHATFSELGERTSDGTTTGVFKLLEDGDVEVAVLPFVVTSSRLTWMNFIWPTTMNKIYLFVAVGELKDWASYLKPFETDLWTVLSIWILVSASMLSILYKTTEADISLSRAAGDGIFHNFQPFCSQGGEVPTQWKLFVARLMPYINALVLLPAYSGAILAFITVPIYNVPFRNLQGFIEDGTYKLSIILDTFAYQYFTEADGYMPRIVRSKKLILPDDIQPTNAETGFERMCKDLSQVYTDSVPPNKGIGCRIVKVHNELFGQPLGMAVPEHFPYQSLAVRLVRRIQSAGLMELFQTLEMPSPPDISFKAIDFASIQALMILYLIFIAASLIILLVEILIKKSLEKTQFVTFLK